MSNLSNTVDSMDTDICIICFDYKVDVKINNCKHEFCFTCMTKWKSKRNVCPICMQDIDRFSGSNPLFDHLNKMDVITNWDSSSGEEISDESDDDDDDYDVDDDDDDVDDNDNDSSVIVVEYDQNDEQDFNMDDIENYSFEDSGDSDVDDESGIENFVNIFSANGSVASEHHHDTGSDYDLDDDTMDIDYVDDDDSDDTSDDSFYSEDPLSPDSDDYSDFIAAEQLEQSLYLGDEDIAHDSESDLDSILLNEVLSENVDFDEVNEFSPYFMDDSD